MTGQLRHPESLSRPLRVLFVTRKWRPAVGGMENYSHELTASLESRCELSIRALPGKPNGMPPSILRQLTFLASSAWYVALNARRFDVVHIGDLLLWPLALAGRIASRRVSAVISAHGTDIAYPLRPGLLASVYGLYLRSGARLLRSSRVVANSSATALHCRNAGFDVAATIPLGVRVNSAHSTLPKTGNFVLFVGRLIRGKGCGWFIREVLGRLEDNIRLKVAGTEWDRDESAALRESRVDFLGPVYGADLAALRQQAVAVIVPNLSRDGRDFEGFGLTATEAAADGGVVLASRVHGLVDAIIDGTSGFLLPPGNALAWASKIEEIARWPRAQRQSFVDESRSVVAKYYSWERVAAATLEVYRSAGLPNDSSAHGKA